ncbi:MAG: hypothetical protein PHD40_08605, partial [Syntrophomonadaceae bacterium]|nr:hypothetical protein [Syntrophomonadaceae bacterium]
QQIAASYTLSESLKTNLTEQVAINTGATLSDIRYQYAGDKLQVMAEVLTPQEIDYRQVSRIEKSLQETVNPNIHLIIRSLISRDSDKSGYVFISEDEKARRFEENKQNLFISRASGLLKEVLLFFPGCYLADIQNIVENNVNNLYVVIQTPSEIKPEQVAVMEKHLVTNLNEPIYLTVRSVITREADSTRYLYDDKDRTSKLNEAELIFHNKLMQTLREELKAYEPAINLIEFNYGTKDGVILVIAKIRTPYIFGPEQVKEVENSLQEKIYPDLKLIVRSVIGADATSEWYLGEYEDALLDTVAH